MSLVEQVQRNLTPDLLKGRWAASQSHPLQGHCYVASEALWHLLPDKSDWVPTCASFTDDKGKATHWWLRHKVTGERLDPTAAQFPAGPPYELGRGSGFLTSQPSKRAQIVIDRIKGLNTF